MERSHSEKTSVKLLELVGQEPIDQAAWQTFVAYYGPKIHGWCRQGGLHAADAEDVRKSLAALARRGTDLYLRPVSDISGLAPLGNPARALRLLRETESGARSKAAAMRAWRRCSNPARRRRPHGALERGVLPRAGEPACDIVRARVEPQTWEAFLLTACEGRSAEEAATLLGMNLTAVSKAKSRVLGFIRAEVKRLDKEP